MEFAVKKFLRYIAIFAIAMMLSSLTGCTSCHSESSETSSSTSTTSESNDIAESESGNEDSRADGLSGLIDRGIDEANKMSNEVDAAIDNAKNSRPVDARIGEWASATENLDVKVDSVEKGPYDYADSTPTMKVTVSMRNLTDHTLTVKASNWNADNTDGQRVDHKLWVKDNGGNIADRSFELTRISPGSVFTGVVYFDGDGLVGVVYEPHWLVSSQNQYIYFDVS